MIPPRRLSSFRPDLLWAGQRYPLPILASLLATAWVLLEEFNRPLAREFVPYPQEIKVTVSLIAAFFAATAAEFATARLGSLWRWAAQAAAFLLGLGIFLSFDPKHLGVTGLPFLAALICLMSLAAGYAARKGTTGFWLANARLAFILMVGAVALAVAILGGGTILAAIEALLDIKTEAIGLALLITASWFGLPLFWLSLARFDDLEPAKGNLLLRVLGAVTDALLIPLMLVFAAVIHLYAARIAILGELPRGQIGWVVPAYLLAGYVTFLLAYGPEALLPRVRAFFSRFWVWGTLIPILLLALAIAERIQAYGWTEERHALVLVTIGGTALAAFALIRRPLDIRLVPLMGGVLLLVMAVGPLSALNVSIRSQTARARAILASVPPERWATEEDGRLSDRQKQDLFSAVQFLSRRTSPELETLAPVWPQALSKDITALRTVLRAGERRQVSLVFPEGEKVIVLETLTLLETPYFRWTHEPQTLGSGPLSFSLHAQGHFLEVSGAGATTRFDLSPLLTLNETADTASNPVLRSIDGRKGDLIVMQFGRKEGPDGAELQHLSARIVLY
jgi:hypothetical protein